jgi:tetratricopeptide (TPR) repeat protein
MDERRVPPTGLTLKCPRCKNPLTVTREGVVPTVAAPAEPPAPPEMPAAPPPPEAPAEPSLGNLASVAPARITAPTAAAVARQMTMAPPAPGQLPAPVDVDAPSEQAASEPHETTAPFERDAPAETSAADFEGGVEPGGEPGVSVPAAVSLDVGQAHPIAAPVEDPGLDFAIASNLPGSPAEAKANPFAAAAEAMATETDSPDALAAARHLVELSDAGQGPPTTVKRWHVRRKSGKIFGPFDVPTIIEMLQQRHLSGTEDISLDKEEWKPISSEESFAAQIKPGPAAFSEGTPAPVEAPAAEAEAPKAETGALPRVGARPAPPVLERGVTAAKPAAPPVMGFDRTTTTRARQLAKAPAWLRPVLLRLQPAMDKARARPAVPIAAAASVVIMGVGLGLGATKYGYFGYKLLKRRDRAAEAAAAKSLDAFKTDWDEGTFTGCQHALTDAQNAVTVAPEMPAAIMDLSLASARLAQRYSTSKAELERARDLVTKKLDQKSPEGKIARAAIDMADGGGKLAEARSLLDPLARDARAETLYGEVLLAQKDYKAAVKHLDAVIAAHPSGEASMQRAEAAHLLSDAAGERSALAALLQKTPAHARAQLWLARLDLNPGEGKSDEAVEILKNLLVAPAVRSLDTTEEALGHRLSGDILVAHKRYVDAAEEYKKAVAGDSSNVENRIALAQLLLRTHQWADAVAAYDKALERSSSDVRLIVGSARALTHVESYTKASDKIDDAKKKAPQDPQVWVAASELQVALHHYPEAHRANQEALRNDPKFVPALVSEGSLLLTEGLLDDAKKSLETAVQIDPTDASAQVALGQFRLAANAPKDALESFNAALKLDADNAEAESGLADALSRTDQLPAATDAARKAVTVEPRNIPYREQLALLLKKAGNLDGALEQLKAGVAVDAKDAHLQALMGGVLLDLDRADEAETTLKTALQLKEAEPLAQEYEARLLSVIKGDTPLAIEHAKRAVELAPKDAEIRYQLGLIYERGQMLGEAADTYRATLGLDDGYLDAREHLGIVQVGQGGYTEAEANFRKVLEKDANRPATYAELADAEFKAGDITASIKDFKEALKLDPKQGALQYKLGRAYDKQGMSTEAGEAYVAATKLEPTDPMPYYYLGYLYKAKGRSKDAIAAFSNYLKYNKDAKDADEITDEIAFLKEGKP